MSEKKHHKKPGRPQKYGRPKPKRRGSNLGEVMDFLKKAGAKSVEKVEGLDGMLSVDDGLYLAIADESGENKVMISFPIDLPPDVSAMVALALSATKSRMVENLVIVQCHQIVEEEGERMIQFIGDEEDPESEDEFDDDFDD